MNLEIINVNGKNVALLKYSGIAIREVGDALDLMAEANELGSQKIILHETQLSPDFFDLKTRLAGEILQKFSNYRVQLAIMGNFEKYPGQPLKDFIYECNNSNHISFVSNAEEARERLGK